MDLVLGVDAGGTASRAVLATVDGTIVGRGASGPGNPLSAGSAAGVAVRTALREALGRTPPTAVTGAVLGVAGIESATDPAAQIFTPMWQELGLTCTPAHVGDVVTAFAAGTPEPSGTVLIAGTGAIAARVTGHRVAATADGWGWLLGDEGGGRWIGLQTVRAAVRDWSGPLGELVAARSGAASAEEAVRWAQALPLTEIGALTRPVCEAARSGHPAATRIIDSAVDHLIATLDDLATPGPVVLAGSLLVADTPVRDGVLAVLQKREVPTGTAHDPAAAAAWLAAREISPLPADLLHHALVGGR
jgi:N-acetylglucosamine kinase-like BadF-type ATPase